MELKRRQTCGKETLGVGVGPCWGWGWGRRAAATQDVIRVATCTLRRAEDAKQAELGARVNHRHSDKQAKCQLILSFNCPSLISGYKVGMVEETQSAAAYSLHIQ